MDQQSCIDHNLIFTGLMGAGKSTIGKLVATGLGREFIDTDQFLEEHYGSPQKILNEPNGDASFKAIEEDIAQTLAQRKNLVIATGGRFCLNPHNVSVLSKNSKFLCLVAPLEILVERLNTAAQDTYRPKFLAAKNKLQLMKDLDTLSDPHLSDFEKITTAGKSPTEVANQIIERFR